MAELKPKKDEKGRWTEESKDWWLDRWKSGEIDAKTIEKEAKVTPAVPYQWDAARKKKRGQGTIANKQPSGFGAAANTPARADSSEEVIALRAEVAKLKG